MGDPIRALAARAREAQPALARASGATRRAALEAIAEAIDARADTILEANAADLASGEGLSAAQLDRLRLDEARIASMSAGVRAIAHQPEVVGQVVRGWVLPNGLRVRQVRVPLGVVGVIYENRPNVTSDASALALGAGNAICLRGSRHALRSNLAIVRAIHHGLCAVGLPSALVGLVEDTSREGAVRFMQLEGLIDLLVPRGGQELIRSVRQHATIPVVIDGDGNCHIYVDEFADLAKAIPIVVNAKLQRPGVCNAVETLLVHERVAPDFLPRLAAELVDCEVRADPRALALIEHAVPAREEDWATEFLDRILAIRVVGSLEEAIEHIRRYSTGHSEAIITEHATNWHVFEREVDAACVLLNASTRFVDGGELGLGAEIGISTQKLHARGPMGMEALTSVRLVVEGDGQVRT
jgi:glutamate-5-semialdehyde dehydrogenase